MSEHRISTELDGDVGILTLSRPEKRNALDRRTLEELCEGVSRLDAEARVIVLRGEGPSFCAGVDLTELGDPKALSADRVVESVALGRRTTDALRRARAVTVAAIGGHCVGGGVVLAASCDLRLASEDTVFRIPEVDLGIPLVWGGIHSLLRSMPAAIAKELVMTSRAFDAAEAQRIGFVNRVVAVNRLAREAEALAARIATKPAAALAITKAQFSALEPTPDGVDEAAAVLAAIAGDVSAITARD